MLRTWAILAGLLLFTSSVTIFSNNAYSESNIVILEVEPNPAGTDAGNEWVRLFNPSSNSINLSGWQISSTHGNTNTHNLSGNIGACDDIKIIFPSQFIDNEAESLILYDNTGSVVNSTPTIYDTSNDGSTWKITTPSCDSSQPEPTPEPELEYLPNGCPVGNPYIWSDGFCYSVPEPVTTQPTTPKQSKQTGNTYYVYVDELPSWADHAVNAVYDSTRYWEKPNPELKFYIADNPNYADFSVKWVKDFGGEQHIGYAFGDFLVEVGLGDSDCHGKWQPYSANYVAQIMTHEFGHVLGLDHSNDVNSIMYPTSINLEYGTVEEEFTLTEGYAQFYSICTIKDKTSINYWVGVDDPTYGFDVYFVPSVKSFDDWADGKPFKYYSDEGCLGKDYRSFSGTCNGVSEGSGLLVIMDSTLTNPLTQVTIKTTEIQTARSFSSPTIATEDPTFPTIPTTPRIPTTPTIVGVVGILGVVGIVGKVGSSVAIVGDEKLLAVWISVVFIVTWVNGFVNVLSIITSKPLPSETPLQVPLNER